MNRPETLIASQPALNRYGQSIQLVDAGSPLTGQSLNINGNPAVSENPDRYKQHGCISCSKVTRMRQPDAPIG